MKKENGITTLVGVIIIVAVAVILFGGVFAWQYFTKSQIPMTNVQPNPNVQNQNVSNAGPALSEVEGWKTYTNTQYGFEFKYPFEAIISEADITSGRSVTLQINANQRKRTFEIQIINTNPSSQCESTSGADPSFVKINGVNFIKYYESKNYSADVSTSAYKYCAFIEYDRVIYNLIPRIESRDSFEADSDAILNQMLSTFKFTK